MLEPDDDEEMSQADSLETYQNPKMIHIAESILQDYNVQEAKKPLYLKRIMQLIQDVENTNLLENSLTYPGVGNLYLLLLPKELLKDEQGTAYLCMEGGIPYDPMKVGLTNEQLVEGLQSEDPSIMEKFYGEDCVFFPQGRLICSSLTPEKGIKIFKVNALPNDFQESYLEEIKQLAQEIFNHSNFLRLKIPVLNL